jgi:hypothetical protein
VWLQGFVSAVLYLLFESFMMCVCVIVLLCSCLWLVVETTFEITSSWESTLTPPLKQLQVVDQL